MSRGPKAVPLELLEAERTELRRLLRRRGVGQALAQRIRVVLTCAEPGATNLGVAKAEPPRICRRLFGLSYAAMGISSSMAQ